jgi:hypothetical protein
MDNQKSVISIMLMKKEMKLTNLSVQENSHRQGKPLANLGTILVGQNSAQHCCGKSSSS